MKFKVTIQMVDELMPHVFQIQARSLLALWLTINGHISIELGSLKSFTVERIPG